MLIDLLISPAKAGPVDFHIYTLSPSGGNLFTPGITAQMSVPSKGIAPLDGPVGARRAESLPRLRRARETGGPTATCANKFSIPFSGKWLIVIRALRNQFDEVAVQRTVNIRRDRKHRMGKRIAVTSAMVGAIVCALAAPAAARDGRPAVGAEGLDGEALVPRPERRADRACDRGADRVSRRRRNADPDRVGRAEAGMDREGVDAQADPADPDRRRHDQRGRQPRSTGKPRPRPTRSRPSSSASSPSTPTACPTTRTKSCSERSRPTRTAPPCAGSIP